MEGTYAPYSYRTDSGDLTGIDVDMAKEIGKKMGIKVVFVPTKWDSLVAGLQDHKYDIILNDMAVSPARMKVFRYGAKYIYTGELSSLRRIQVSSKLLILRARRLLSQQLVTM